ncbi:hypothetical protein KTQ42_17505|uniref:hypothetical protein n=1 Tax=Noviherbaspirillum sp. L7-7A TaxID=2850560 RepID=UPI001C2C601A|nr:hypothetical protein [Noviherbaspirillum sp. L7-7A]MBV0881095.1 hypothetical protein [Noviherbaspirillum sp. L7-7A]
MLEMLAAVTEMEWDLLVARTQSSLAMAKTASRALGRPSKTSTEQRTVITADHAASVRVSELARRFAVSRANVFSIVKPLNEDAVDNHLSQLMKPHYKKILSRNFTPSGSNNT